MKQVTEHEIASIDDNKFISVLPTAQTAQILQNLTKSKSQLRQDLFVLSELEFKKNGFFVEFGATDGILLSNTYLLEKEFNWTGILAEPAKCWHDDLSANRSASIETRCVWTNSGSTIDFNEVDLAGLSTISSFSSVDFHRDARKVGKTYEVETISLNDLLEKYSAPRQIDYLSIDTEGSEFEILNALDLNKYQFNVITCEHNFTRMRRDIHALLSRNGYVRKYVRLSQIDDWYTREC